MKYLNHLELTSKVKQGNLSLDTTLTNKKVQLTPPGQVPIIGQVIEAYMDIDGIIHFIKLKKEDGKITIIEVGDISMTVLTTVSKWFPWLWRWISKIFEKRGIVK